MRIFDDISITVFYLRAPWNNVIRRHFYTQILSLNKQTNKKNRNFFLFHLYPASNKQTR